MSAKHNTQQLVVGDAIEWTPDGEPDVEHRDIGIVEEIHPNGRWLCYFSFTKQIPVWTAIRLCRK